MFKNVLYAAQYQRIHPVFNPIQQSAAFPLGYTGINYNAFEARDVLSESYHTSTLTIVFEQFRI